MDRDACEDRGDDCAHTPKNAHSHDDVEWNAHLAHSKDSAVLQENGHFGEHKAGVVADDTPEEVLEYVSLGLYMLYEFSPLR